jgi:hypothetical protein
MEEEELVRGAQAISLVLRLLAAVGGVAIVSLFVWIWRARAR